MDRILNKSSALEIKDLDSYKLRLSIVWRFFPLIAVLPIFLSWLIHAMFYDLPQGICAYLCIVVPLVLIPFFVIPLWFDFDKLAGKHEVLRRFCMMAGMELPFFAYIVYFSFSLKQGDDGLFVAGYYMVGILTSPIAAAIGVIIAEVLSRVLGYVSWVDGERGR